MNRIKPELIPFIKQKQEQVKHKFEFIEFVDSVLMLQAAKPPVTSTWAAFAALSPKEVKLLSVYLIFRETLPNRKEKSLFL